MLRYIAATESGAPIFNRASVTIFQVATKRMDLQMSYKKEESIGKTELESASSAASGNEPVTVPDAEPMTATDAPAAEPKRDADWIAEVSHELRLPIANLKLLIETLLDGALEDQNAARRMLNRAQTEVDRLQRLVVDLLSVEQTSSSRDVQKFWVALETRALDAIETTKKQAQEKSIRMHMQIEPGFYIFANPEQLDQVLLNLVENAIKFTPEGGTITIASGAEPGIFSVEDTGIGMAAQEIPKIFQRFYRIDRAKTRGSTGLGLSIVKHIADLHGAKISVTSEEGRGSKFQLEFPPPRSTVR